MKNSKPIGYTIQDLAARVQYWIVRDLEVFCWPTSERITLSRWLQFHTCGQIKPPRLPKQLLHRKKGVGDKKNYTCHLQSFAGDFKERFNAAVSCAPTSINLKKFYRSSILQQEGSLDFCKHHSVNWQLKEQFFVSKRLQPLPREAKTTVSQRQVISIPDLRKG